MGGGGKTLGLACAGCFEGGGHKVQNIGASGPGVVRNLKFDLGRDVAL